MIFHNKKQPLKAAKLSTRVKRLAPMHGLCKEVFTVYGDSISKNYGKNFHVQLYFDDVMRRIKRQ